METKAQDRNLEGGDKTGAARTEQVVVPWLPHAETQARQRLIPDAGRSKPCSEPITG